MAQRGRVLDQMKKAKEAIEEAKSFERSLQGRTALEQASKAHEQALKAFNL